MTKELIEIKVVPFGIPQHILNVNPSITETKIIKLTRVPVIGEWIIWRNQNFQISKVIHLTEDDTCTAIVLMDWRES
uniref:Phage protein n=1 Tax=Tolypothrix bouteillei VB521301 TaxID=1479485 RepID=A0A0C1N1P5_9CYAN